MKGRVGGSAHRPGRPGSASEARQRSRGVVLHLAGAQPLWRAPCNTVASASNHSTRCGRPKSRPTSIITELRPSVSLLLLVLGSLRLHSSPFVLSSSFTSRASACLSRTSRRLGTDNSNPSHRYPSPPASFTRTTTRELVGRPPRTVLLPSRRFLGTLHSATIIQQQKRHRQDVGRLASGGQCHEQPRQDQRQVRVRDHL